MQSRNRRFSAAFSWPYLAALRRQHNRAHNQHQNRRSQHHQYPSQRTPPKSSPIPPRAREASLLNLRRRPISNGTNW
jgi:hypothetical protein